MKIDRLIGIISVLQNSKKVTAPYLADMFEVSRRTINRDIEDICKAGIPLVTTQGKNGGITVMDGFNIDRALLTQEELQAIFIGLKSLDSVSETPVSKMLSLKFSGSGLNEEINSNMNIDLSSFYKESYTKKISVIRKAIREHRLISFHYYYKKGEADKLIEPYMLMYKWSSWYVYGFCTERQDFRMYKLNRLWNMQITDNTFVPRKINNEDINPGSNITDECVIKVIFDHCVKYRLIEDNGPDSFTVMEDGKLLFEWKCTDADEALYQILAYGEHAMIVDPPEMKTRIKEIIKEMLNKYD